jgi:hypothetical protein
LKQGAGQLCLAINIQIPTRNLANAFGHTVTAMSIYGETDRLHVQALQFFLKSAISEIPGWMNRPKFNLGMCLLKNATKPTATMCV